MSYSSNPYPLYVGPRSASDGVSMGSLRGNRTGEQVISLNHGRYAEASGRGKIFMAQAIVTAPVIWTTEAGTGGPLLWNGSSSVVCNILAVGLGQSVAATVAGALGLTGGYGQTAAPTSTTAIDSQSCLYLDTSTPQASVYRVGTTGTNRFFIPFASVGTGALTVVETTLHWIDLGGIVTVPQNGFVSIAASATLTTGVFDMALVWEEIPV